MRLVQVTIPAGKRETVLDILSEEGIDYVLTDETSRRDPVAIVSFPLPTGAVEEVLSQLRDAGIDDRAYTVVLDAETVVSRNFEQLRERYAEEDKSESRIAREEIHARAEDLAPTLPVFVTMTVISAVIATAGLLLDSPAVVVGSMVIAPLIGPAMATSVGSVIDDTEMFRRGAKLQAIGLGLAVVSATGFALVLRTTNVVPPGLDVLGIGQIRSRLTPDVLSLAIALGAGAAGAISLASGVSAAIVGVMIAAALVPPIGVIGIGIAWGLPRVVFASVVLVLVNTFAINLAALAVFWYQGYRPQQWFREDDARAATLKRIAVLIAAILVLAAFLGAVTLSSFQSATAEQEIRGAVSDVVSSPRYEDVTLLSVDVEQTDDVVFREPERVVVTVGIPTADPPPDLRSRIDSAVGRAVDQDIAVQVRYVTIQDEDASDATSGSNRLLGQRTHPDSLPASTRWEPRTEFHRGLDGGRPTDPSLVTKR